MLTFISPALISRVYAAFDQDQRERALTLLRQAFLTHSQGHVVADNDFISELEQQASKAVQRCEFERAEQLYRLALDLYEKRLFQMLCSSIDQAASSCLIPSTNLIP